MLNFAEGKLIQAIGAFGTVGTVTEQYGMRYKTPIDINSGNIYSFNTPGQCQAFLTSSREFVWFIEQYDVTANEQSLQNKRIYPAKVKGLNLALLGLFNSPTFVTTRWREGLIRYSNLIDSTGYVIPCLRPGFGQQIIDDLNRPLLSETVTTNHLGLIGATANSPAFWGPLGRILSMAFNVDETIAAKYNASQSKKKKKSLNSQDYEQMPTYPTYDTWINNTGY